MIALAAFVLPLGLDAFVVAAALGAGGRLTGRDRWRVTVLFVAFEAGMPLLGLAIGAPLARATGGVADYLAAVAVIAVGAWMLLHDDDDEAERAEGLRTAQGFTLLGLGVSISLDELAVGFGLGLSGPPIGPLVLAIGLQALLAVQLGLLLGARIGERLREAAERLAGIALVLLGLVLLAEQVLG